MPRNSIESDRSRSRHRYVTSSISGGGGKGTTPLPQIPDAVMHDHYQPANRQEYLFYPNRFQPQQQQQAPHSHHAAPSDMRTPVAWTLRDATLSHPRSATAAPFNMATHHSHHHPHHQPNHAFDSISLHQSSISGRDHRRQHPHPYPKKQQANGGRHAQRTSSPSATTTSSDDRDEIPIVRHPHHRRQHAADGRRSVISRSSHMNHVAPEFHQVHHMMHHPHHHGYTSDRSNAYGITMGTLRSTKSVPALAVMQQQHDSCPVHDQQLIRHPTGAYSVIHAPIYADRRMLAGHGNSVVDLRSLPPPLPPQMQPPAAMMTNFEAKKLQTAIQLPLPQGLYTGSSPAGRHILLQHSNNGKQQICSPLDLYGVTGTPDPSCCKGHLIVLWIILAVVTLGVISGIVLGVTMN